MPVPPDPDYNVIIKANAAQIPLADNSVHCVVTSPPYWGLRKYAGEQETQWPDGTRSAYGLEPTLEQYVEHSLVILREVRRVLREDGTCWWNLGDSYSSYRDSKAVPDSLRNGNGTAVEEGANNRNPSLLRKSGLKHLDLCLIPERVALAAQADGWYVRSLVIWSKPNPMPESVNGWRWERHRVKVKSQDYREYSQTGKLSSGEASGGHRNRDAIGGVWLGGAQWGACPGCEKCSPDDGLVLRKGSWRPTDAYEHILMLTKTADYFGDAEAVKEASSGLSGGGFSQKTSDGMHSVIGGGVQVGRPPDNGTRNLRNVWTFPTQSFSGAHFATFPERLPEICIRASTSECGCCLKCGANGVRIVEPTQAYKEILNQNQSHPYGKPVGVREFSSKTGGICAERETLGWRPSCSCNAGDPVPCTVLDPFGGSGTTARVALRLNRRPILLDLAYQGLQKRRISNLQPQLQMI